VDLQALASAACARGREAGLDAVGITTAEPFEGARRVIEDRKARGLHGGMQFTYRNPERATDPGRTFPGARALVAGARSYARVATDELCTDGPVGEVARYSWVDHYAPLRVALGAVADVLVAAGWQAWVLADDNALVDRAVAHRAGLGWYGKNTNLLLPGVGSEFVLGAVITDAPLPPTAAAPLDAGGCGSCARCLPACPTGALGAPSATGATADSMIATGGQLDARRCLAWLLQQDGVFPRQFRVALGGRLYGCDDCQVACPPNRLQIRRRPIPAEPDAQVTVAVLELLETSDDATLLERFGRWYIPRREARYLRRNALVVLANTGDGRDPRTAAVVRAALASPDPLLRAHAVWAAARLDRRDLLTHPTSDVGEDDPLVLAELGALPDPR